MSPYCPNVSRERKERGWRDLCEKVIFELTGEILLTRTETGGEQGVEACSKQGGFICTPVKDQKIEVLEFQVSSFHF